MKYKSGHNYISDLVILTSLFLACSWTISSAQTTKDSLILCENLVILTSHGSRKLDNQLLSLIKQKATFKGKRLFPSLADWVYNRGEHIKRNNFLKKLLFKIGNPYTVYDSSATNATIISMNNYLYNHGYFNGSVHSSQIINNDCLTLTYEVSPGPQFKLNEVNFLSDDRSIQLFLQNIKNNTFLLPGKVASDEIFRLELARIDRYLKNNGFAAFSTSYIQTLPADTIGSLTNVTIEILKPNNSIEHLQYHLGEIHIYPNYNIANSIYQDTIINGINFHTNDSTFIVPSKVLLSKLKFSPKRLYSYKDYLNTYRSFNNLEAYKFVSIENLVSPRDSTILDYHIKLTPSEKWAFNAGAGISVADGKGIQLPSNNVLSINSNISLKNRNLYNSGWSASISLSGRTELGLQKSNAIIVSSFSWEAGTNIVFPKYIDFPGTMQFLNFVNLISDNHLEDFKRDAGSNLNISISASNFPAFYSFSSINSNLEYEYHIQDYELNIQTSSLEYYRPDTGALFSEFTKGSEFAKKSFLGTRMFTSAFFKSLIYGRLSKVNRYGLQWGINGLIEQSGIELKLINKLFNLATNNDNIWSIKTADENIEFGHFIRGQFDLKMYAYLSKESYFAFRLGPGIAYALGDQVVPYIKQYYVGGPISNRAWNAREIGPGTDPSISNIEETQPFFSTGDFKLDLNAEFRFKIWGYFKSALFIDAANVWNLKEDNDLHKLSWSFINELAVGVGYGFRFDFDIFLLRADFGYKILNPYKANGTRSFYTSEYPFSLRSITRDATLNIAVGMPFR